MKVLENFLFTVLALSVGCSTTKGATLTQKRTVQAENRTSVSHSAPTTSAFVIEYFPNWRKVILSPMTALDRKYGTTLATLPATEIEGVRALEILRVHWSSFGSLSEFPAEIYVASLLLTPGAKAMFVQPSSPGPKGATSYLWVPFPKSGHTQLPPTSVRGEGFFYILGPNFQNRF